MVNIISTSVGPVENAIQKTYINNNILSDKSLAKRVAIPAQTLVRSKGVKTVIACIDTRSVRKE
jgi:hypothetical protein